MGLMPFTAWIPGAPRGKGSVRVAAGGFAYKDKQTENYMALAILTMRDARRGAPTIDAPTSVRIRAYLPRPGGLVPKVGPRVRAEQPPADAFPAPVKPDLDNLQKSILDSLTQAGVIVDDCRVVTVECSKFYAAIGGEVGVRVEVEPAVGCWVRG